MRTELPAGFTSGYRATVPLVDMPVYLGYLQRRLRDAGGTVEWRGVGSLDEAQPAVAVINCSGLGARALPLTRASGRFEASTSSSATRA
ncbi:hypothetical protein [Actinacidiphila cocklensis]|uniref:D-amino-acid oxidase n=1 Tax=Actinacidiphila cocklensis TaxID=887465 RepID=A0A9W4DSN6_9ACTN|nr:hypothetical protein [Actinacidiphila cocklensis]CAG6394854.1 hypothetical protein SCOCK_30087 [Actinacidiphila cocklensis]